MSDVIQQNIQDWRRRAAAGELTLEEAREAVRAIRKERVEASATSAKSRSKKAAAAPIDSDALLGELGI